MKKAKIFVCVFLIAAVLLSGCSAGKAFDLEGAVDYNSSADYGKTPQSPALTDSSEEKGEAGGSQSTAFAPEFVDDGRKIIYSTHLEIESLDFDKNLAAILSQLEAAGGYAANSDMSGGLYSDGSSRSRYVRLELKVPAENYTAFLSGEDFGNIVSRSDSSEDITSSYVDTEARLDTLRVQEQRLLDLLNKSGSLEELLTIENYLSNVRYEIESYTAQKNTYDRLVKYCTVTINLNEVKQITVVSDRFGARVLAAITGSLRNTVVFLENTVIFLIGILPLAVIVAAIVLVLVSLRKRAKRRKQAAAGVKNAQNAGTIEKE